MSHSVYLATLALLGAGLSSTALAAPPAPDCAKLASVQASSLVQANNQFGGVLNAYVDGQTPPPGHSQKDKLLFRNADNWNQAYTQFKQASPAQRCATVANDGAEIAIVVVSAFASQRCIAADKLGRCTESRQEYTDAAQIVLRYQGKHQRWIVYSAQPRHL